MNYGDCLMTTKVCVLLLSLAVLSAGCSSSDSGSSSATDTSPDAPAYPLGDLGFEIEQDVTDEPAPQQEWPSVFQLSAGGGQAESDRFVLRFNIGAPSGAGTAESTSFRLGGVTIVGAESPNAEQESSEGASE